eukprot:gene21535-biopygen1815
MNSCHEEGVREHPPRDMSSSETGHCYGGIDDYSSMRHISTPHKSINNQNFRHVGTGKPYSNMSQTLVLT